MEMKAKTREDALLHCFDLWIDMAVTGGLHKVGWPGWKDNGGYLDECVADCPCCEYVLDEGCIKCPIEWGSKLKTGPFCLSELSSYHKWAVAETSRQRTKYALEIAALALKALG